MERLTKNEFYKGDNMLTNIEAKVWGEKELWRLASEAAVEDSGLSSREVLCCQEQMHT